MCKNWINDNEMDQRKGKREREIERDAHKQRLWRLEDIL